MSKHNVSFSIYVYDGGIECFWMSQSQYVLFVFKWNPCFAFFVESKVEELKTKNQNIKAKKQKQNRSEFFLLFSDFFYRNSHTLLSSLHNNIFTRIYWKQKQHEENDGYIFAKNKQNKNQTTMTTVKKERVIQKL